MNRQTALEAAELYAGLGISSFPIWDKYKVPAKGSHGHIEATTNMDEFTVLMDRFPGYASLGIALRMGDPLPDGGFLVCLDIDEKNGASGSYELSARAWDVPVTVWADTRSGGKHFLLRSDKPSKCKIKMLPGVDVKGVGGWIAASPTSGYEWYQEPCLELLALVPHWMSSRTVKATRNETGGMGVRSRELISCPVSGHDDSTPSCQITTLLDGNKLYHCFGGCNWIDVAQAVEEGLLA